MRVILSLALIIGGVFMVLFGIGSMDEDWDICLQRKQKCLVAVCCLAQAAGIACWQKGTSFLAQCLLCVLAGCLLMACVMDLRNHMVYCFVWKVGGGAVGIYLLVRGIWDWSVLGRLSFLGISSLFWFVLIQYLLFGRMYGKADCHAFSICAAVLTALGLGFQDYVAHMAVAFLGLAVTQAFHKNIASDGNLKVPVPLVPYITMAFWVWLDFRELLVRCLSIRY